MPKNQRSAVMRERMLAYCFGPRLERVLVPDEAKPKPKFHGYVVDTHLNPDFIRPTCPISREPEVAEHVVIERQYGCYADKQVSAGYSEVDIPYSIIHSDLIAPGRAGLRHDAKLEAVPVVKELWRDVTGIRTIKTLFDDENKRLVLKIHTKDLARFDEEVRTGARTKPQPSENILWAERFNEAREVGCDDKRYWSPGQ